MAKKQDDQIKQLNLHIKILTRPDNTVREMLDAMTTVYSQANIVVNLETTQQLDVNQNELEFLNEIDVGDCDLVPSDEQIELSRFRDNADNTDVVVYICEVVINIHGAIDGCSTHPPGSPMAVISSHASIYTMAHEIGHLLGLKHAPEQFKHRLMNPAPPQIPAPPPPVKLTRFEINKMRISPLLERS